MKTTIIVLALLALIATAATSETPENCAPTHIIHDRLKSLYREVPVMRGLNAKGNLLEIYASESGTWTAVFSSPAGMSCIASVGQAYEGLAESLLSPGKDM